MGSTDKMLNHLWEPWVRGRCFPMICPYAWPAHSSLAFIDGGIVYQQCREQGESLVWPFCLLGGKIHTFSQKPWAEYTSKKQQRKGGPNALSRASFSINSLFRRIIKHPTWENPAYHWSWNGKPCQQHSLKWGQHLGLSLHSTSSQDSDWSEWDVKDILQLF